MVCEGLRDWVVPRRLMCFLFWSGTILLFVGILLVVTSKHKGTVFLWWGGITLSVGACVLIVCLVLCVHAYYVIAESQNNAEHAFINTLQMQRKAQYSVQADSEGEWQATGHSFPETGLRTISGGRTNSNGYTELIHVTENGTRADVGYRTIPSEGDLGNEKRAEEAAKGLGKQSDGLLKDREAKATENISKYSVISNSTGAVDTTTSESRFRSSRPPPSYSQLARFPSRPEDIHTHPGVTTHSAPPASITEASPSSVSPASSLPPRRPNTAGQAKLDHPHRNQNLDYGCPASKTSLQSQKQNSLENRNTSSQSSAFNSSTECELDVEVRHTLLTQPRTSAQPRTATRLRNNTPVDSSYQFDDAIEPADFLVKRPAPRLPLNMTFEEQVSHADELWRKPTTQPHVVHDTKLPTDAEHPRTPEEERTPGSTRRHQALSITRPFGHGTVTVTPLYRPAPPKTPPSGVRHPEQRGNREGSSKSPEALQTATPLQSGGRQVPTVSVTPCIADREVDISVCQSDVTVYDNILDTVLV